MTQSVLGVVIVTFDAAGDIAACLETLFAAAEQDGTALRVVVVDNASGDDTVAQLRAWAAGTLHGAIPSDLPFPVPAVAKPIAVADGSSAHARLTLLETGVNGGFAAGVNAGLRQLFAAPDLSRVWILNPDSVVPAGTPAAFASHDPGPFALMGGRVTYLERPGMIQIDGGLLNRRTGVTGNVNLYRDVATARLPDAGDVDFITGASMVVSRPFYDAAGAMAEDYFLYYEEVDWAMRRGALPLAVCPGARVYHRGGTSIGSPVPGRPASPFSLYFKHRARLRFMRRYFPRSLPWAWAYTLAKAGQYLLKGWRAEAAATLAGARGAPPPAAIRQRLSPEAAEKAFSAR